ncbi:Glyco 3-alpha-L-fucosyltransferase A [Brachionus plicatilis]|uniref:Fucosyltransferase n=1 Tax=Brachionus plicatilis TaxID=10195 RepID=A0A3M7RNM0_BRAPC|nr:Glyco 3-alpha-L-fucosyltransferase A [Brachionus plicatilis]
MSGIIFKITKFKRRRKIKYFELVRDIHLQKLKAVQLITPRFENPDWQFGHLGEHPFKGCPESRCFAFRSKNHLHIPEPESDGVMVHSKELFYMPSKNYNRSPRQLWMFYTLEPQRLSFCSNFYRLTDFDDWFNLTATFKTDSDVPLSYRDFSEWSDLEYDQLYIDQYQKLAKKKNLTDFTLNLKAKSKNASIAWFVSHCNTNSRREDYVKELSKHINVDVFGKCSSQKIREPCYRSKSQQCNNFLNRYKFRLAFENSLCDDYISEKFWDIYSYNKLFDINLVNVVRGAKEEQYRKVIPFSKFYINADWFDSPKKLADYLNYLNENDTAYLEYFSWKVDLYQKIGLNAQNTSLVRSRLEKRYQGEEFIIKEPFCKLCQYLHNESYLNNHQNNRRWSISKWFGHETSCWDKKLVERLIYLGVELNEDSSDTSHLDKRKRALRLVLIELKNNELITEKTSAYLKLHYASAILWNGNDKS